MNPAAQALPPEVRAKLERMRKSALGVNDMVYDAEKNMAYCVVSKSESGIELVPPVVIKVPANVMLTFTANLILASQGVMVTGAKQ